MKPKQITSQRRSAKPRHVTTGEEVLKPKKAEMVRISSSYLQNVLTVPLPVQPSLFDSLTPEQKETLQRDLSTDEDGVKAWINKKGEGLADLPAGEQKLILCLHNLLKEQSQEVYDANKPGYYLGKSQDRYTVDFDGNTIVMDCAQVQVGKYELAKMFNNDKPPSGNDMQRIDEMLERFDSDRHSYPLKWKMKMKTDGKGNLSVREVTEYRTLLRVSKTEDFTIDPTGNRIPQAQGYLITFHPLFSRQIEGYVAIRGDTYRTLKSPQGAAHQLFLFVAQQYSHKKKHGDWKAYGNEEDLFRLMFYKDHKGRKRSKMEANFLKAVEACKGTGLILAAQRTTGAQGQALWEFELNPDYESEEDSI